MGLDSIQYDVLIVWWAGRQVGRVELCEVGVELSKVRLGHMGSGM